MKTQHKGTIVMLAFITSAALAQTPENAPGADTSHPSPTPPAATDASKATDIGVNAATKTPNDVAPAEIAFMQTLTVGNLAEIDVRISPTAATCRLRHAGYLDVDYDGRSY